MVLSEGKVWNKRVCRDREQWPPGCGWGVTGRWGWGSSVLPLIQTFWGYTAEVVVQPNALATELHTLQ